MSSVLLGSEYTETPAEVGGQHAFLVFSQLLLNSVILSVYDKWTTDSAY